MKHRSLFDGYCGDLWSVFRHDDGRSNPLLKNTMGGLITEECTTEEDIGYWIGIGGSE
jgi:hypothetical protein